MTNVGFKVWKIGYQDGINGREAQVAIESVNYANGYDIGCCDRPSLEELSLDVTKEACDPLGS